MTITPAVRARAHDHDHHPDPQWPDPLDRAGRSPAISKDPPRSRVTRRWRWRRRSTCGTRNIAGPLRPQLGRSRPSAPGSCPTRRSSTSSSGSATCRPRSTWQQFSPDSYFAGPLPPLLPRRDPGRPNGSQNKDSASGDPDPGRSGLHPRPVPQRLLRRPPRSSSAEKPQRTVQPTHNLRPSHGRASGPAPRPRRRGAASDLDPGVGESAFRRVARRFRRRNRASLLGGCRSLLRNGRGSRSPVSPAENRSQSRQETRCRSFARTLRGYIRSDNRFASRSSAGDRSSGSRCTLSRLKRARVRERPIERQVQLSFRSDLQPQPRAQHLGDPVILPVVDVVETALEQEPLGGVALVVEHHHDRAQARVGQSSKAPCRSSETSHRPPAPAAAASGSPCSPPPSPARRSPSTCNRPAPETRSASRSPGPRPQTASRPRRRSPSSARPAAGSAARTAALVVIAAAGFDLPGAVRRLHLRRDTAASWSSACARASRSMKSCSRTS